MFKHKFKAFVIHFLLSLFIVIIFMSVVFYAWYPNPLYKATGIIEILLLILGIHLIVAPLLTFLVYKPNKKTLKLDIGIIVVLQLATFMFGVYQLYNTRPVWIVYYETMFELIVNNQVDDKNILMAMPQYQKPSNTGATYVTAVISNKAIESEVMADLMDYGIVVTQRPELYQPISVANQDIVREANDLTLLNEYNDDKQVAQILEKYPEADSFLPLRANTLDMTVLIDKDAEDKVVKIVDLRPW